MKGRFEALWLLAPLFQQLGFRYTSMASWCWQALTKLLIP